MDTARVEEGKNLWTPKSLKAPLYFHSQCNFSDYVKHTTMQLSTSGAADRSLGKRVHQFCSLL